MHRISPNKKRFRRTNSINRAIKSANNDSGNILPLSPPPSSIKKLETKKKVIKRTNNDNSSPSKRTRSKDGTIASALRKKTESPKSTNNSLLKTEDEDTNGAHDLRTSLNKSLPESESSSPLKNNTAKKHLFEDLLKIQQSINTETGKFLPNHMHKRKPKLKYRPALNEVFYIDEYVNNKSNSAVDTETGHFADDNSKKAYFLKYALVHSKKVIIISGAGISVGAGIPDFRSSSGLFNVLKKENKVSSGKDLFDFNHVYSTDIETCKFNKMVCEMHYATKMTKPTYFHKMLDWMSYQNRLKRVYTQNIDGLEVRLPNLDTQTPLNGKKPYPTVIQLHGSVNHMSCCKCNNIYDFDPTLFKTQTSTLEQNKNSIDNSTVISQSKKSIDNISMKEDVDIPDTSVSDKKNNTTQVVPLCPSCKEIEVVRQIAGKRAQGIGKLRPRVVLYNEFHPDGEKIGDIVAQDLNSKPDCLIIVGTTLKIPGVRRMCKEFAKTIHSRNGIVIWINNEVPSRSLQDFLECIDLIVVGDCQTLPLIL
ncbi:related to NAD-dependent histone deacetylase HST4 [Saccharomycodes ludwigii]|uniref:Related to NAD-dependent histone deacetylase HST4 n=1 Tax=Saccharomycodes ludwigii TaxID=36035 RepID=A0A376B0Y4_9ASCO|nr:hypothetical protein SCDLUD_001867 [Saccharomycodes ludwigii]KAH3902056.1 hypothetical protein SCDLUD_001867 [Saccharomycodes ludwigii]SSD58289.1 related to NAD-dependent histone deacetylase HST4 [Saccharomycodes ludwigii]